jgi:hypothetical protein
VTPREKEIRVKFATGQAWTPAGAKAVRDLLDMLDEARDERDVAQATARILAHAYEHDSRPPEAVVAAALAYPIYGQRGTVEP